MFFFAERAHDLPLRRAGRRALAGRALAGRELAGRAGFADADAGRRADPGRAFDAGRADAGRLLGVAMLTLAEMTLSLRRSFAG